MPRDETSASDSSDNEAPEAVSLEASKVAALERRAAELEASKECACATRLRAIRARCIHLRPAFAVR